MHSAAALSGGATAEHESDDSDDSDDEDDSDDSDEQRKGATKGPADDESDESQDSDIGEPTVSVEEAAAPTPGPPKAAVYAVDDRANFNERFQKGEPLSVHRRGRQ